MARIGPSETVARVFMAAAPRVSAVRPSPVDLQNLYERLSSVNAVAAELGVSFETARRWLRADDIDIRPKGRPSSHAQVLNDAALVSRYRAGESIADIGHSLGVSPTTVRNRLLKAGEPLRPRAGWTY